MYQPTVGERVPGPDGQGDLRLTEVLGAGAFGIVFGAISEITGERFAVKFLQGGFMQEQRERLALANEMVAAGRIQHPNVVKIVLGQADGHRFAPFVITEFANGGTLHARIEGARSEGKQFPLGLVREWSEALVEGMRAINSQFLHRDLKPDNILFHDGVLKVSDFGLAKLKDAATRTRTFKGIQAIHFMAPEAWVGQSDRVQGDMYSVGIVLYMIATLEFPFALGGAAWDVEGARQMHLLGTARNPREHRAELPFRFCQMVLRLLEKRPDSRYESWDDVLEAVRGAFEEAEAPSLSPRLKKTLEIASARHQENQRILLEKEAAKHRAQEEREIDKRHGLELVEHVERFVRAFNREIEAPKAELGQSDDRAWVLKIPYAPMAYVQYFWLKPELNFPQGVVRLVGIMHSGSPAGLNFILARRPGELYGTWHAIWVKARVVTGFPDTPIEGPLVCGNATMFGHAAASLQAGGLYELEFQDDIPAAIERYVELLQNP